VVAELCELVDEHPGKTKIFFQLRDSTGRNHVLLHSKSKFIDVKRQLLDYIEQNDGLDYTIY
jgi:DNA polymerase-3 subunit alpha